MAQAAIFVFKDSISLTHVNVHVKLQDDKVSQGEPNVDSCK